MQSIKIKISEVSDLLKKKKTVKVKTINNEYVNITKYVEKGILPTYEIRLVNGLTIKTSADHLIFTDSGWNMTKELLPGQHKVLCDTNEYVQVESVTYVGDYPIVDIQVDHKDESYFGNGMLHHNSGKSLLAAHALANTQKMGGLAVYIDTENAISTEFLSAIGVNLKEMLYVPLETVEDIFEATEGIIESVRKANKDKPVTIVVDSVAGASTKTEMAAEWDKDGYNTTKAIILSKAMRKITNLIGREKILLIFTNQLRAKMNAPAFSDPWTTSGGKAIAFHSSVRLRLSPAGMIKVERNGTKEVAGIQTIAKVIKNRMGPPLRTVEYPIYFDRGIDDDFSLLDMLKKLEILTGSAGNYSYVDTDTGEVIKFKTKDFRKTILEDSKIKDQMYNRLCEQYVLKYKDHDVELTDELTIDSSLEGIGE